MKIIQSEGGPLIGFDQRLVHRWGGVNDKSFIDKTSPYESDYLALDEVYPRDKIAPNIAKITGIDGVAPLITLPQETAVIGLYGTAVYLSQVEWAEFGWDFYSIDPKFFVETSFCDKDKVFFAVNDCEFMFFDAAYAADWIRDDFLSFPLKGGQYVLSDALYRQGNLAQLILLKIEKV